ncbi:MAG: hypothetical protein CL677_10445 [Bdellovibrionaceae bacterium]|nr:hypothetical protein [Pseudobdellovibrionaceae bacterium]
MEFDERNIIAFKGRAIVGAGVGKGLEKVKKRLRLCKDLYCIVKEYLFKSSIHLHKKRGFHAR